MSSGGAGPGGSGDGDSEGQWPGGVERSGGPFSPAYVDDGAGFRRVHYRHGRRRDLPERPKGGA
eukprot:10341133-Lingulodinium_polyedra.AAC.1